MSEHLQGYTTLRGSDVNRDGLYLELIETISGDEVAEVFFFDEENRMQISIFKPDMRLEVIEAFIAKAKHELPIP